MVILGFGYLYGHGIFVCWFAPPGTSPTFKPEYVYVATALAGLIGGVVAMVFNEKLPDAPAPQTPKPAPNDPTPSASGVDATLAAVKNSVVGTKADFLTIVSAIYVLVYFAAGVFAIITWVKMSEHTPDLIKNLALICIGLFVAIARSFFNVPPPKP